MAETPNTTTDKVVSPFANLSISDYKKGLNELVKKIGDVTSNTQIELSKLNDHITSIRENYEGNDEHTKLFIKEYLNNSVAALFNRTFVPSNSSEIALANRIISNVLDLILTHLRLTLPLKEMQRMPSVVTELEDYLTQPPQPPTFPSLPGENNATSTHANTSTNGTNGSIADNVRSNFTEMMNPMHANATNTNTAVSGNGDDISNPPPQTSANHLSLEPFPSTVDNTAADKPSFLTLIRSQNPSVPAKPAANNNLKDLDMFIFDTLDLLFDESKQFYQRYGNEKPASPTNADKTNNNASTNGEKSAESDSAANTDSSVSLALPEETPEYIEWRSKLSKSGYIDCFDESNKKWRSAQIVDGSLGTTNQWRIQYDGENDGSNTEWIDTTSNRFAELHSKSFACIEQWRKDLAVGTHIDALDTVSKWYTSKVVEIRGDQVKVSYDGWNSRYDEFLPRTSSRIAPYKSKAGGGKDSGTSDSDRNLDDNNDDVEDTSAAVFRGTQWGSNYLVAAIKHFAANNGFDMIINRIVFRAYTPMPVQVLRRAVDAVSRCWALFHKSFANQFIPLFRLAVTETLCELNDVEMRQLSKENLEEIAKSLEKLMRRVYSPRDILCFLDKFMLDNALKRFRSTLIERQVNGISYFQEICNQPKRTIHANWLSPPSIIYFIIKNKILEDSFCSTAHSEFMNRSKDLLKFISNEKKLTREHLYLVWSALESAMKQRDEAKLTVLYKVFDDIAGNLDNSHVDFLFEKVESVPHSEIQAQTLDLIKELTRWTHKSGANATKKAIQLLWEIINNEQNTANAEIKTVARQRFEEIIKNKNFRLEYMEKCVENINNSKSSHQMMLLLNQLIETYPEHNHHHSMLFTNAATNGNNGNVEQSKTTVINYLNEQFFLIKAFFHDLTQLKTATKTLIEQANLPAQSIMINGIIVSSNTSYLVQIKDKLTFLQYILTTSNTIQLSKEDINTLFELLDQNSYTMSEREQFFRWLRSLVQLKSKNFGIFSDEVCSYIFNEKLINGISLNDFTLPVYTCFEQFFLYINSQHKSIELSGSTSQNGYVSYMSNSSNQANSIEEFKVLTFDFIGFDSLWNIVLECTSSDVVNKAIAFLNKLHESLHDSLKHELTQIRTRYLDQCMQHFREYCSSGKTQRAQRCLLLLNQMLDQSEMNRGIGSLRPHSTSTRGKLLRLTLQNALKKSDKPNKIPIKIHSNDTLFELREMVSKELGVSHDQLKLFANGAVLNSADNNKSLKELRIRDETSILVSKRPATLNKADLLDSKSQPTQSFRTALLDIFYKFAMGENRLMSKVDFAAYILACGAGESSASEDRVSRDFASYGLKDTNNEYMNGDGWIEFYRQATLVRVETVWSDLRVHGYRIDLRKETDISVETKENKTEGVVDDEKTLPRYLLSTKEEYFHTLFQALNNSNDTERAIAPTVWQLLQRIPTNPELYNDLYSLEEVSHANPDWNSLLDSNSMYKLLYSLQILESLAHYSCYRMFTLFEQYSNQQYDTDSNNSNSRNDRTSLNKQSPVSTALLIWLKPSNP